MDRASNGRGTTPHPPRLLAVLAGVALLGGSVRAEDAIPGPPGWSSFGPSGQGIVASYRLPQPDGTARQSLSAAVYPNFASLDDFVQKNAKLLHSSTSVRVLKEERTTVCGQPAWTVSYSRPGAFSTDAPTITEQVVRFHDNRAAITTYVRLEGDQSRPDAEQWIRAQCSLG